MDQFDTPRAEREESSITLRKVMESVFLIVAVIATMSCGAFMASAPLFFATETSVQTLVIAGNVLLGASLVLAGAWIGGELLRDMATGEFFRR